MDEFQYKTGFSEQQSDFHSRDLLINPTDFAFFINGYAETSDFNGEIGWYKWQLDDNSIRSLKSIIEAGRFLSDLDYHHDLVPGQLTKIFSFEKGKSNKTYVFNADDPLPDPFEDLQKLYYEVMDKSRGFPWKTLRVEIDPQTNAVRFRDYLNLVMTFSNTGTTEIYFANPSSPQSGTVEFMLQFSRQNVLPEEISSHDFFSVDLLKTELLLSEKEVLSSHLRMLKLNPSEALTLRCHFLIPKCIAGEYYMGLVFNSVGSEEDLENQEFVDGEIHTPERRLLIQKK